MVTSFEDVPGLCSVYQQYYICLYSRTLFICVTASMHICYVEVSGFSKTTAGNSHQVLFLVETIFQSKLYVFCYLLVYILDHLFLECFPYLNRNALLQPILASLKVVPI